MEVCINGNWATVCSDSWDIAEAGVVCVQLGLRREGECVCVCVCVGVGVRTCVCGCV